MDSQEKILELKLNVMKAKGQEETRPLHVS